ncbi:pentapeptide repeat-containing protein, partial [Streptomyces sp. YS-3]|uniref:pentapeptide repeat-containing protein n=1 Tax=Streptomyces sp. YS-3 TaxID=3381352 RepID=UPI0038628B76
MELPSMSPPPPPVPSAPSWAHCGQGADPAADPVGCRGIHVPGHTTCLAHLADADRGTYLAGLSPGADIDHRGTPFTQELLTQLLNALHDPLTTRPHLGDAHFEGAQFSGDVWFGGAKFSGIAQFNGAQFSGDVWFGGAKFSGGAGFGWAEFSGEAGFVAAQFPDGAWFAGAEFSGGTRFEGAEFSRGAWFIEAHFSGGTRFAGARFAGGAVFREAEFSGDAQFSQAQFSDSAWFDQAQFSGSAWFDGAQFSGYAGFPEVQFEGVPVLGPLVCAGRVVLSRAVFRLPVTLEIAAREVVCERTVWQSTATVRLRYAAVDLGHAVLSAPVAVTAHAIPFTRTAFTGRGAPVGEDLLTGPDRVQVTSVQGVDAAHLVLSDTDLSACLFSGAFHLDQLRLEGRTRFAPVPAGWHRRGARPVRWTRRRTLAEEHHWRAQAAGQPAPLPGRALSARQW